MGINWSWAGPPGGDHLKPGSEPCILEGEGTFQAQGPDPRVVLGSKSSKEPRAPQFIESGKAGGEGCRRGQASHPVHGRDPGSTGGGWGGWRAESKSLASPICTGHPLGLLL